MSRGDGLDLLKPFLPGLESALDDPDVSEIMINGPGNVWHGFDARPLGQGPGSRLGIGHHSWPQPTRPPLRRLKATAQRHVGPEGRLVYTSADRDGQNGNSGWNVLTGGSHVVQESAPSRTQMSTTHAWRFRRLRARVSLVIPW